MAVASRAKSSRSGSANTRSSRFAEASSTNNPSPFRTVTPPISTSSSATRRGENCTGVMKRRSSSTAASTSRRIVGEPPPQAVVAQDQQHPHPDHVGGRVVASAQNHGADLREVVAAQAARLHLGFDDAAYQVVAGVRFLGVDQAADVRRERPRFLVRLARRLGQAVPSHCAVDDEAVILVRGADQLGHDERRKLHRERGREIGRRTLCGELVDHGIRRSPGSAARARASGAR